MGRNFRDHICHSKLKHYFIFMVFQNICLVPLEQRQKGNYSVVVKSFCCGSVQLGISVLPLLAQRAWLFLCFSLFDCKMKLVIILPHSVVEGIERDDAWKVWHRAWKKTLNDTQQLFLYDYIVGELVEKFIFFFFHILRLRLKQQSCYFYTSEESLPWRYSKGLSLSNENHLGI